MTRTADEPGPTRRTIGVGRRLAALVVFVLTLISASPIPATAAPDTAAPATDGQDVAITLTTVSPTIATLADTVTLAGTVTNTSNRTISSVQIHLWRSLDLITTTDGLDQALESAPSDPVGARLLDVTHGQVQWLPSQANPTLAPGESATFQLSAPVSTGGFGFTTSQAVALIGVQVRGIPQGQANQTVGRARTLMPIVGDSQPGYAEVVVLASTPSQLHGTVFSDDHLASELTGRLSTLLDEALTAGRTVVVDPELIEAVTAMSQGYTVQGSTASTASGQQAAAAWLRRFAPLYNSGRLYQGLYGTPNIALAATQNDSSLINELQLAADDLPTSSLPVAVVASDATQQMLDYLAPLKATLIVTSGASRSGVNDANTIIASASSAPSAPAPGIASDPQLQASLAAADLLASASGTPAMHLVTEPDDISQLAGLQGFRVLSLVEAVSTTPLTLATNSDTTTPNAAWLTQLRHARSQYQAWNKITADNTPVGDPNKVISRSWSTRFASASTATSWLRLATQDLNGYLVTGPVTLQSKDTFVMGSGGVQIPFTVTNTFPTQITIKLTFVSESPQRISVPDTDTVTIDPGESDTIMASPHANGNATVNVEARLTTADGTPIGQSHEITIQATQLGDAGWVIVIASGVVFLGATAWRIRAVQRSQRRQSA